MDEPIIHSVEVPHGEPVFAVQPPYPYSGTNQLQADTELLNPQDMPTSNERDCSISMPSVIAPDNKRSQNPYQTLY